MRKLTEAAACRPRRPKNLLLLLRPVPSQHLVKTYFFTHLAKNAAYWRFKCWSEESTSGSVKQLKKKRRFMGSKMEWTFGKKYTRGRYITKIKCLFQITKTAWQSEQRIMGTESSKRSTWKVRLTLPAYYKSRTGIHRFLTYLYFMYYCFCWSFKLVQLFHFIKKTNQEL